MKEPFSNDHLLERILSAENVRQAWKQVRANKGAPGIDGVTVEQFPDSFRELWPQIRSDLLEGTYVPSPVLRLGKSAHDGIRQVKQFVGQGCKTAVDTDLSNMKICGVVRSIFFGGESLN